MAKPPTWRFEREFWLNGRPRVAGVDEVGRGPLAGPVFAAAVVLPFSKARWQSKLRDSKQLEAPERAEIARYIRRHAEWAIGSVSAQVIDQLNIVWATRLAMRMAVRGLSSPPDAVLVDGREVIYCGLEQRAVVDADELSKSVAAASIVAKVARDEMMCALDTRFPGYGFARNKGYSSVEHREALQRLGYSTVHRLTFAPVRAAVRGGPVQVDQPEVLAATMTNPR